MKKLLIRGLIVVVILVMLAVVAIAFFLDGAIKRGVETVGPQVAKVDVKVDSVSVSLFSGSGKVNTLVLGNPEGFKTPHSMRVGLAGLSVSPASLLSDKVIVKSVRVESPEIIFEVDGSGQANLMKIKSNLSSDTLPATNTPAATKKATKKLQVDDFVITGGKVTLATSLLGGQSFTAPLPEIHFTNLGTGPEGITAAELTKRILSEITDKSLEVGQKLLAENGKVLMEAATKTATESVDKAKKAATDSLEKSTKGVTDLFKKKE
jgi:uncharacterized protein involved in outer membrane biogenesis